MNSYEEEKEELRKQVELFHSLDRLKNNVDFKRVILKGFCETEVINLTRQASKEMTTEAKLSKSQQAQAGPVLEAYLTRIRNEGQMAQAKIPELDAIIAEEKSED